MSNKILKVWIEKEGVILDKSINFKISKNSSGYVKIVDSVSQTTQIGIETEVSLKEYQEGYIGKYANENKTWLQRFIQQYAITHNLTLVINPLDFRTNAEDLYKEFQEFCVKNKLETLLKPTGGSAYMVYDEFNYADIENSLKYNSHIDESLTSAIDWYNVGLLQTKTSNQFLHYFIPLEILTAKFITDSGTTWKDENKEEYKMITDFLKGILKNDSSNKLSGLISFLSELSFVEKIKRYFKSIFSEGEIVKFWLDDTDVTFNGKRPWKQYRLISQQGVNKEGVDLFNVLKDLYQKRNDIVHKGIENVSSEDIFVIENILRRVLKKEIGIVKKR